MFVSSFFAILIAGLIIALVNRSFLRHERWCRTADAFCVNIENVIIDYFDVYDDEAKREVMNKKFYAYLDAFIFFAEKKSGRKIDALLADLVLFDIIKNDDDDQKERMRKTLNVLATIRYEITQ